MRSAAQQAIRQAGWTTSTLSDVRTGLCAATSKGDIARLLDLHTRWRAGNLEGQAAGFTLTWPDGPGQAITNLFGMTGPAVCPVAACATGTHALIRAAQMIADGDADRVLVVAGDASLNPLMLGAFRQLGVLTPNACRPFDRSRSGFFISEGAAAVTIERGTAAPGCDSFVVSPSACSAPAAAPALRRPCEADRPRGPLSRGDAPRLTASRRTPLVELLAWQTGADPSGITAQDTTGRTLAGLIQRLLARAGRRPGDVRLYSAHGTATRSNDLAEARAIQAVFGGEASQPRVFAAKSILGHLLGAAGLAEAIIAIEAIRRSTHPPTANLNEIDADCRVRIVRQAEPADLPAAICASLGFGCQIGLLALGRIGEQSACDSPR